MASGWSRSSNQQSDNPERYDSSSDGDFIQPQQETAYQSSPADQMYHNENYAGPAITERHDYYNRFDGSPVSAAHINLVMELKISSRAWANTLARNDITVEGPDRTMVFKVELKEGDRGRSTIYRMPIGILRISLKIPEDYYILQEEDKCTAVSDMCSYARDYFREVFAPTAKLSGRCDIQAAEGNTRLHIIIHLLGRELTGFVVNHIEQDLDYPPFDHSEQERVTVDHLQLSKCNTEECKFCAEETDGHIQENNLDEDERLETDFHSLHQNAGSENTDTGNQSADGNRNQPAEDRTPVIEALKTGTDDDKWVKLYKTVFGGLPPQTVSFYDMPAPPSVIVCYTTRNRPGSKDEADELMEAFRHHKIEPMRLEDPTIEIMSDKIKQESASNLTSALFVCVMMHGFEGFVECSDGHLPIQNILKLMDSKIMEGKPKILVVQACRTQPSTKATFRTEKGCYDLRGPDMLVMNASYAGSLAARNVMIPMLAKALKVSEGTADIQLTLLPIANEMKKKEPGQALVCYNSLRNRLLLSKRDLTYDKVITELFNLITQLKTEEETKALSTRIPEILSHLETWKQKALILGSIKQDQDVIQLCIDKKHYKLLIWFLSKIEPADMRLYRKNRSSLLVEAIESGDDRYLSAIIRSYKIMSVDLRESIQKLPEDVRLKLFEGSWGSEVILSMYGVQESFFIPMGQKKAKLYAINFMMSSSKNYTPPNLVDGLKTANFKVRKPVKTLEKLALSIEKVKDRCSLLVIWISTGYDRNKETINKAGTSTDLDNVMQRLKILPSHIPAVVLAQRCLDKGTEIDPTKDPHVGIPVLERPNTLVVTATGNNHSFLKYVGDAICKSDGDTPFITMVDECKDKIATEGPYLNRGPSLCGILSQAIILPRALNLESKSKYAVVQKGYFGEYRSIFHDYMKLFVPQYPFRQTKRISRAFSKRMQVTSTRVATPGDI